RNPDLVRAAERLPDYESRLRALARQHAHRDARGMATMVLAEHLKQQAGRRAKGTDPVQLTPQAIELLEKAALQYGDVKYGNFEGVGWVTLGVQARKELAALGRSIEWLGRPAPEIEGEDLDGKPLKLSDYRGKVVVLSFWFSTCVPCRALIPHEQALVKRIECNT